MDNTLDSNNKSQRSVWLCLIVILLLALCFRLAGIWRSEPIDYYPDEDKIARPVFSLANHAQVGLKRDYNWPMCGVIYPFGYALYGLKGWFGPYSYHNILIIQRILSTLVGTGTIFVVFLLMKKLFSVKTALIAASFVAIGKLPVRLDHDGYLRSCVSLIIITVMLLSYDLFDVNKKSNGHEDLKTGRCSMLGFICGWGVAIRWTMVLSVLPISGAMLLSIWYHRKNGDWKTFIKTNIKRIGIIAAIATISFLAGNPDFQFSPEKVMSGVLLQKQQGKVGHYGKFVDRSDSLAYKFSNIAQNMTKCGSIYLFIPGIIATICCFLKPTRAKIFLLWTMFLWLFVLHRNVLPLEKYHLVPFIIMLLLISICLSAGTEYKKHWAKVTAFVLYAFLIITGSLYTLIWISPYWKTDARILCSRWIKANVSQDSGVTWAPRTHKWMLPGRVVDPSLFKMYPRQARPDKDQYIMASKNMMNVFKKHPPFKPVNPDDWFPSKPPTMNELLIYAEMNNGGGPNLKLVKEFSTKPSFLGLDLRLFGLRPVQDTTSANWAVSLFRVNRKNEK